MTWLKDITALFSPFIAAQLPESDLSGGLAVSTPLEGIDPNVIAEELAKRYKESHYRLAVQDIDGKPWFVLNRASDQRSTDLSQPIIPFGAVEGIAFTKAGVALRMPYGFLPVLQDSGLALNQYPAGEGQQLYVYIPYNDYSKTGLIFSDRMWTVVRDYEDNPLRAQNKVPNMIGVLRDERNDRAVEFPVFLLYPPEFDYFKAYSIKSDGLKFDFNWTLDGVQDICMIVDDSGSASGTSLETKFGALLDVTGSRGLVPLLFAKKTSRIHLLSSTTGKEKVVEFGAPELKITSKTPEAGKLPEIKTESGDPKARDERIASLKGTIIESLKTFFRPAGEEENLKVALARCNGIIGVTAANDPENAYVFLLTDEEAEIPCKCLEKDDIFKIVPVPADAAYIGLAQGLNLPIALVEQLLDPLVADQYGGEKEVNDLIGGVRQRVAASDTNFTAVINEVMAYYKTVHDEERGEEKFRIMLSLLTLVPQEKAGDIIKWLTDIIKDKGLDYPAKKRAAYLIGFFGSKGNQQVFDILMGLKKEIKDERLRHDISRAIAFLSSVDRAKALWEIAEIDPNGVDLDEVRSCGMNDWTAKILSLLIVEGMGDVRAGAIGIINDLLMESQSDIVLNELVKLKADQLLSLYWRPAHITALKEALIKVQPLYGPNEKTSGYIEKALKGLGDVSLVISPKVSWEERQSFTLNRINIPHYYVKVDLNAGLNAIKGLRSEASTEEAFLYIKDDDDVETWFEHGDKEDVGSTQPLPAQLMQEAIKIEPEDIVEVHLHPGQFTGTMGINDVPSINDLIFVLSNSASYRDIYGDVNYEHRIITPNGTFILRPKELTTEEVKEILRDSSSDIMQAIVAYNNYTADVMHGNKAADIGEIKKLLEPIAEVDFVQAVIPAVVSGDLVN